MNETCKTILERRTFHEFDNTPIDSTLLRKALELAILAPNHQLTNPWRFIRIGPRTRQKIADIAVTTKAEKFGVSDLAKKNIRKIMTDAPELLIVIQKLDRESRRKEDYAACACAVQNFMLALSSFGIGSKWSTSGYIYSVALYELLQISRDHGEIIGAVMIGYGERPSTPIRTALDDVYSETD